jgi:hypothetical protein
LKRSWVQRFVPYPVPPEVPELPELAEPLVPPLPVPPEWPDPTPSVEEPVEEGDPLLEPERSDSRCFFDFRVSSPLRRPSLLSEVSPSFGIALCTR